MNFFEHQDRARRQSRWLILLFVLAVLAIIAAIDAVLLMVLGGAWSSDPGVQPWSLAGLQANRGLLFAGAGATASVIGLASLFRMAQLRAGGGQVARSLGGILLESDPGDPLRRRLRNVVEEISLASGVPVPEIYVLEQEAGINAFAAGYSPSDAAVAVTRGTLEKLDRDELQGVIAHEFSHILNGDMRMNLRLMGALFGILVLALVGRRVLLESRHWRGSRDRSGGAIVLVAFGVMAIGYIGQFFGRWIKAAVSRQREYLADASAVQFTRDPSGIAGALKKIGVYAEGSWLDADPEEVSHMLFGTGRRMLLFATHPPLLQRIGRIEPGFDERALAEFATQLARRADTAARRREAGRDTPGGPAGFDADGVIERIGQPGWEQILLAATLAASIAPAVHRAAASAEWAPAVLLYVLLDRDPEIRERQLLRIAVRLGQDSESQVRALLDAGGLPSPGQKLPLLELALPALRRRPAVFVGEILATVQELVRADDRIEVFEFVLARSIAQYLWESQNPHIARVTGTASLDGCREPALRVLSVLAHHGQDAAAATDAFRAGVAVLGFSPAGEPPGTVDWAVVLDRDLPLLDRLTAAAKERFVRALLATIGFDRQAKPVELELLRVICALVHVPLPIMAGALPG